MKTLSQIIWFSILLFLFSCSLLQEPEPVTIADSNNEFLINLNQELVVGDNPLVLEVETLLPPLCQESEILLDQQWNFGTLFFLIENISTPENCQPANTSIRSELALTAPTNKYPLEIIVRSTMHNRGTLTVSPGKYEVFLEQTNGISLQKSELLRIPDQVFWGSLEINDSQDQSILEEVFTLLESRFGNHDLTSGDYGYFRIDNQGNIHSKYTPGRMFGIDFLFSLDGGVEILENFILEIKNIYPQITIQVTTGTGNTF